MKNKTIKILPVLLSILLLSPIAYANGNNEVNTDNTRMNQYNALENKMSFEEMINTPVPIKIKTPEIVIVSDNTLEKLREITDKENMSMDTIANATDNLKSRSNIKTFLIGNNLGILKFQLVQIEDQESVLTKLSTLSDSNENKIKIGNQIKFLQDKQVEVASFITAQEGEFSLFGWLVRML